jgi:hypothetical protein
LLSKNKKRKRALIKLWHGSSRCFRKFERRFIGTGEGASGEGYGFYLVDNSHGAKSHSGKALNSNRHNKEQNSGKYFYEVALDLLDEEVIFLGEGFSLQHPIIHDKWKLLFPNSDGTRLYSEYQLLRSEKGDFQASASLISVGIKAIKCYEQENYLKAPNVSDSGYTYLCFDERKIKILSCWEYKRCLVELPYKWSKVKPYK